MENYQFLALVFCGVSYLVLFLVIDHQRKLIKELSDRFMARDYREFKAAEVFKAPTKKEAEEKPKKYIDPVLGSNF